MLWSKIHPSTLQEGKQSVFLVGELTQEQIDSIVFGDEGQGYKLISCKEFISAEGVVPQFQERVREYLEEKEK